MSIEDLLSKANQQREANERSAPKPEFSKTLTSGFPLKAIDNDKLPKPFREVVDQIASSILDPDNLNTIIVGGPRSGKSFFLSQFVNNLDSYSGVFQNTTMHFIPLTNIELTERRSFDKLKKWAEDTRTVLECEPNEICFVVESADAALYLANVLPNYRVLLEINALSFAHVAEALRSSPARMLDSWRVIDVDEVEFGPDDLVELLSLTALVSINKYMREKRTRRHVRTFVNVLLKDERSVFTESDDGTLALTSPGVLATLFRWTVIDYNNSIGRGETVKFADVVSRCYNKHAFDLGLFVDDDDEGSIQSLISAQFNPRSVERAMTVSARGGLGMSDVKSLAFSDATTLEARLRETVIGQDEAVRRASESLLIPAAGLNSPNKPVRSFLFMGPTGVGKTQLALDIAHEVATQPMNVVRIDMSEFQQSHEVSKLFGSPPGYIGHTEGGLLTTAVSENPQSLVLLDEVEKAHPRVWDAFLQVLDSGRMTDSQGIEVDFTQCIVVMTSNVGASEASKDKSGFSPTMPAASKDRDNAAILKRELNATFRPEFLNRIDDVIVFDSLNEETARLILAREMDLIRSKIHNRGFELSATTDDIVNTLLTKADISKYGAREIQRVVHRSVSTPAAKFIVGNAKTKTLNLALDGHEVIVTGS